MPLPTKSDTQQSFFVFVRDTNTGRVRRIAIPADVQIGRIDNPASLELFGGLSLSTLAFDVSVKNRGIVNVSNNNTIVTIDASIAPASGRITVSLPPSPRNGQLHFIKDVSGTSATSPIDITPASGITIDGDSIKTLSSNFSSIAIFWSSGEWHVLIESAVSSVVSGSSGGDPNAEYVLVSLTGSLPNSRRLVEGSNINIVDGGPGGDITISSTATGGSGADPGASYVVINNTSSLPNERALAVSSDLKLTDGGANSTATIGLSDFNKFQLTQIPDISASYVTIGNTGSLPNERALAVGTGLLKTDGGSGGSVTISINDNVVATISGALFTGVVSASAGLSGSLQQVGPGLSYLVGGAGVNITSQSSGQIIIDSLPLVVHGNISGSETFNFSTGASGSLNHKAIISASCVFTLTPPIISRHCQIQFKYTGGTHVITWPASVKFGFGAQPSWDTTGIYNTANLYWDTDESIWLVMGTTGFA